MRQKLGGGVQYVFMFTPTWENDPIWHFSDGLKPPSRKHRQKNTHIILGGFTKIGRIKLIFFWKSLILSMTSYGSLIQHHFLPFYLQHPPKILKKSPHWPMKRMLHQKKINGISSVFCSLKGQGVSSLHQPPLCQVQRGGGQSYWSREGTSSGRR